MPAAAVIPAPIAYIKVVAVKKLVVGSVGSLSWSGLSAHWLKGPFPRRAGRALRWARVVASWVYFEQIRVFIAGVCPE